MRGVGGTSSSLIFLLSRLDDPIDRFTEVGNSVRLGVIAVTTFRTECLRTSLAFHSRFLAMKKRVAVQAEILEVSNDLLAIRGILHTSNYGDDDHNYDDSNQTTGRYGHGVFGAIASVAYVITTIVPSSSIALVYCW